MNIETDTKDFKNGPSNIGWVKTQKKEKVRVPPLRVPPLRAPPLRVPAPHPKEKFKHIKHNIQIEHTNINMKIETDTAYFKNGPSNIGWV